MSNSYYRVEGDYDLGLGYSWTVLAEGERAVKRYLVKALNWNGMDESYIDSFNIKKINKLTDIEIDCNGDRINYE